MKISVHAGRADIGRAAAALRRACAAVRADGGDRMLATVITDRLDLMEARIARLADLHAADDLVRDVLLGIHVEGPFISPAAEDSPVNGTSATTSEVMKLMSGSCAVGPFFLAAKKRSPKRAAFPLRWRFARVGADRVPVGPPRGFDASCPTPVRGCEYRSRAARLSVA